MLVLGSLSVYYLKIIAKPAITIINPNGAEEIRIGERFRFTINTDIDQEGVLKFYFTKTNDIKEWINEEYYYLGGEESKYFNPDGSIYGTTVLRYDASGEAIEPGTYYMLAEWNDASSSIKYDFTDGSFTILDEENGLVEEKFRFCPDVWADNQEPPFSPIPEERQYFIVGEERRELYEFDLDWVKENCDLEIEISV